MTESSAEAYTEKLHAYLSQTVAMGASDLHMRAGEPPFVRANGRLVPVEGQAALTDDDANGLVMRLTERMPTRRTEFKDNGEADLSYELPGLARFRVNIFRERGRTAMVLRVIPQEVPLLANIGVPPVIEKIAMEHHGLVLVTGATGSGKTTTLAAMIDHMNRNTQKHILTIEDPIEIVHPNHRSLISQREVGSDTGDFGQALRRALRQDPDVILIGEIRDEETMRTALAAAETGHLVLATLHTINCAETIARVLDLFPSDAEKQARAMLAGALKAVISQRLCRTIDGKRAAVVEVMTHTSRIADCILNPEETQKLPEAIAEGGYYGMQTFDQALIALILAGRVSDEEAVQHVSSPQNFKLMLESARATQQMYAGQAAVQPAYEAPADDRVAEAPQQAPGSMGERRGTSTEPMATPARRALDVTTPAQIFPPSVVPPPAAPLVEHTVAAPAPSVAQEVVAAAPVDTPPAPVMSEAAVPAPAMAPPPPAAAPIVAPTMEAVPAPLAPPAPTAEAVLAPTAPTPVPLPVPHQEAILTAPMMPPPPPAIVTGVAAPSAGPMSAPVPAPAGVAVPVAVPVPVPAPVPVPVGIPSAAIPVATSPPVPLTMEPVTAEPAPAAQAPAPPPVPVPVPVPAQPAAVA
ncbi:MAG: PilT/PilU family type 4a pilus ATPase [Thermoleophilia bacterium]|nr:PilT/PilU family type 4a pilus ATPase [Thermoleophilia bacterium]